MCLNDSLKNVVQNYSQVVCHKDTPGPHAGLALHWFLVRCDPGVFPLVLKWFVCVVSYQTLPDVSVESWMQLVHPGTEFQCAVYVQLIATIRMHFRSLTFQMFMLLPDKHPLLHPLLQNVDLVALVSQLSHSCIFREFSNSCFLKASSPQGTQTDCVANTGLHGLVFVISILPHKHVNSRRRAIQQSK